MSLMHDILQRNFKENGICEEAKILDLGLGIGDFVNFMRQGGYDVFGTNFEFKNGQYESTLKGQGKIKKMNIGNKNRATLQKDNIYYLPKIGF